MTSSGTDGKSTLCLHMIVRNESNSIERCLDSVKDIIDYYVIVDTGSEDNTIDVIKNYTEKHGLQGEIHQRPWVNFGHNRDEALQLAYKANKTNYCFLMDADEIFHYSDAKYFKQLTKPCYMVKRKVGNTIYSLPHIFKIDGYNWKWYGVVHNYMKCENGAVATEYLKENIAYIEVPNDKSGGKSYKLSQKEKFLNDAKLLEAELVKNPKDTRSMFYLAQSYRDADEPELALEKYKIRSQMDNGWEDEVFWSLYQIGKLQIELDYPIEECLQSFIKAFDYMPKRTESLLAAARLCREHKKWHQAYMYSLMGKDIPLPENGLFVETTGYHWALIDELAIASYWIGKYDESYKYCKQLLDNPHLPKSSIPRIKENLGYAEAQIEIREEPSYDIDLDSKSAQAIATLCPRSMGVLCLGAELIPLIKKYLPINSELVAVDVEPKANSCLYGEWLAKRNKPSCDLIVISGEKKLRYDFAINSWKYLRPGGFMLFCDTVDESMIGFALDLVENFYQEIEKVLPNVEGSNITAIKKM